ncbi:hypothetical protein B2G51_16010 [Leptospira santarosai]|uniref:Uncharacterized protein n=4 Tax=Leptospira santarosai TaxID=28183 RepID=A0AB73LY68_9LEPT|nr:hypothetical protein B2G51_16010 [Leptospira santarosai]OLY58991.1 hypothetical protein BV917_18740 [Leptospira santarosai serovar Guaricura]ONF89049.1 hypothetical protein BWD13_01210 [Leptospira santarosai serovar Grippotyphosa]ONF93511.1 hypothetical protein BWD14_08245 [Leptospira santarosai]
MVLSAFYFRDLYKMNFSFGDRLQNYNFIQKFDFKIVTFGILYTFLLQSRRILELSQKYFILV